MQSREVILQRLVHAVVVADGEHPCASCGGAVLVLDDDDMVVRVRCRACARPVPAVCARKSLGQKCTCSLVSGQPRHWPSRRR